MIVLWMQNVVALSVESVTSCPAIRLYFVMKNVTYYSLFITHFYPSRLLLKAAGRKITFLLHYHIALSWRTMWFSVYQ